MTNIEENFRFRFRSVWMDFNGVLMVGRILMEFCWPVPVFVTDVYHTHPWCLSTSHTHPELTCTTPSLIPFISRAFSTTSPKLCPLISILLSLPAIRLYVQISKRNDSRCPLIVEPSASILYVSHPAPSITSILAPISIPGSPPPPQTALRQIPWVLTHITRFTMRL